MTSLCQRMTPRKRMEKSSRSLTVALTLIPAPVADLLDVCILFLGVILWQRLVIFGDQLSHLLFKQDHDVVSAALGGFRLSVAIPFVFFFALRVGVIA